MCIYIYIFTYSFIHLFILIYLYLCLDLYLYIFIVLTKAQLVIIMDMHHGYGKIGSPHGLDAPFLLHLGHQVHVLRAGEAWKIFAAIPANDIMKALCPKKKRKSWKIVELVGE